MDGSRVERTMKPDDTFPIYLLNEKTLELVVAQNVEQVAICKSMGFVEIEAGQYRVIKMIRDHFARHETEELSQ